MAEENEELEVASGAEAERSSEESGAAAQDEATRPVSAADAPPVEALAPKERRRARRAARAATRQPGPPRSAEERHEERVAQRGRKAELRRAGRAKAKAKQDHAGAEATPPRQHTPGVQKVRQGVVVSDKAEKTITVRIDTARRHRRYNKIVRTSRTLHAHDERNDASIGDTVIVREARPLSRSKRWRLVRVVERAK